MLNGNAQLEAKMARKPRPQAHRHIPDRLSVDHLLRDYLTIDAPPPTLLTGIASLWDFTGVLRASV